MSEKKRKYPWNKSRNDDGGAENEVYAGPEFFEQSSADPDERRSMEGVYAGPPMPPPMMCVYAGPEYINGTNIRAPGVPAPSPVVGASSYCAECGTALKNEYKFCPGCGAALKNEDE